jgi:hypothetical protein
MERVSRFAFEQQGVRDLIERSSDAVNREDWEALIAMMTADIVWERMPPTPWTLEGRAAVDHFLARNSGKLEILHYDVSISVVDVIDAAHALARSTMHELLRILDSGAVIGVVATYDDRFVKLNGSWFFERRTIMPQHEENPASISFQKVIRTHASQSPRLPAPAGGRL